MECAGHEFRQAEQPEHEGTDCIKKFWLKAFLIKGSNAEQNRNWRIWNSTARIWNPESSYNSEEKAFGIILSSFVGTPPFRTWTPPGSSRRKIYTTQAEGNFSSSFYCSRSTNIILDSLSKYYVFFRNMRIFLLLGTQEPDRPKRELGCLYKKPRRIPNPVCPRSSPLIGLSSCSYEFSTGSRHTEPTGSPVQRLRCMHELLPEKCH